MSSLQDALMGVKGLPDITVRPQVSEKEIERINNTKPKMSDHFSADDLDRCATMRKFKEMAEIILLAKSANISEVIQKAHRFKDDAKPENKKFIWFFYELRDQLKKLPPAKHEELFRKAFRKSGSTFELSGSTRPKK